MERLLKWFEYNMSQDQRGKLMAELPQDYLALVGARPSTVRAVATRVENALNRQLEESKR